MYIRQTTTRRKLTGEIYRSHRLVESRRVGDKVKQVTLLNIGSQFDAPPALWADICARCEQLIGTQTVLFESTYPAAVETVAQLLASQLLTRASTQVDDAAHSASAPNANATATATATARALTAATPTRPTTSAATIAAVSATNPTIPATPANADFLTVNVNSIVDSDPRSIGVEHVGLHALAQLELEPLLASLNIPKTTRAMIASQLVARMAAPDSEAATWAWLNDTSALFEQLNVSFTGGSVMRLHRAADCLVKHRAAIEAHIFKRAADLFALDTTITLYDLTNTYFEGSAAANECAQHGRSKEKRSDCPLITLGLVLDSSGFVQRSKTFAGNVAEGATLAVMLKGLKAPKGAMVIMDAGIATEANLTWLREQQYRYLVVSRSGKREFDFSAGVEVEPRAEAGAGTDTSASTSDATISTSATSTTPPTATTRITAAGGQTITLQKHLHKDGAEVRLYCHSEGREAKETAMTTSSAQRFEAGLQKIAAGLAKVAAGGGGRSEKRYDKLQERIGRLKAQSRGVSRHYAVTLVPDAAHKFALSLTWIKQPVAGTRATHPGVYCLRSNELNWDAEKLWRTYTTLTDLESVFRSLKSELGLRPVYHIKPERVEGYLFITVLAYQCVQLLRTQLGAKGIHESWGTLRKTLSVQRRTTTTMTLQDGRTLHVRKTSKPNAAIAAIYDALGINHTPGGIKKTII